MLDVEVLDLVGGLVDGNDIEELSETMPLEVFFSEVLEVALGESDIDFYIDCLVSVSDSDSLSQFASLAVDFDPLLEELAEVGGVEDSFEVLCL